MMYKKKKWFKLYLLFHVKV
ncbi:proline-rich receptor-like protein kinase PERK2 [Iris pallida]|uniref:Proline-rich receptor-like protein kinase PERK2 n=1 Tax=Iris pallida TaxID=29817 RepID=A0AAX6DTL9_IRIPA|nr:proline-rich receptor-like protein kinase PERK2 [Iris pallida]